MVFVIKVTYCVSFFLLVIVLLVEVYWSLGSDTSVLLSMR